MKKFSQFTDSDDLDYIVGLKNGDNAKIPFTGGIKIGLNFTTNGSGAATLTGFVAAGVTVIDVWLNQSGEQGVKIPTADYTYTAATGIVTGLEASKNYTAYGR